MASFVLLYDNLSDAALLSAGSWLSALPLTNLQDADVEKVARSSDAQNASTKFKVDLGRAFDIGGIAIGPANLSPGATWRWRVYTDSAYSTLLYDSGVLTIPGSVIDWTDSGEWLEWEDPNFWYGINDDFDELPQYLYHVTTANKFAQYSLIEIFDAANFDGAVSLGRLMIARAFRPSLNYGEDNALSIIPVTDMEESLGGKRFYWDRNVRRAYRCSLPQLMESEIFGEAFSVQLKSGISRQVFVVPNPADEISGTRRSFLATIKELSPLQQLLVDRGSTAFDLEEVL